VIKERLFYFDYHIEPVPVYSRIDPSRIVSHTMYVACPHCKKSLPDLTEAETTTCSCGLQMTLKGWYLYCELAEEGDK